MEWTTEAGFRADDPRRAGPLAVEFGSRWFNSAEDDPWRLCWFEATEELVAIQLGLDRPDGPVQLLAADVARHQVEAAFRGWWQVCGHRGSLPWAQHRAEELRTQTPNRGRG